MFHSLWTKKWKVEINLAPKESTIHFQSLTRFIKSFCNKYLSGISLLNVLFSLLSNHTSMPSIDQLPCECLFLRRVIAATYSILPRLCLPISIKYPDCHCVWVSFLRCNSKSNYGQRFVFTTYIIHTLRVGTT